MTSEFFSRWSTMIFGSFCLEVFFLVEKMFRKGMLFLVSVVVEDAFGDQENNDGDHDCGRECRGVFDGSSDFAGDEHELIYDEA